MEVRLPGRRTVVTRPYPDSDPAFAAEVAAALRECHGMTTDAEELRAGVAARLRRTYPNTRVVARETMASLVAGEDVWYVYRDRAIRRPDDRRDRLYQVLAAARRTVEASRTALYDSAGALRRAQAGPTKSRGRARPDDQVPDQLRLDDLTDPETR